MVIGSLQHLCGLIILTSVSRWVFWFVFETHFLLLNPFLRVLAALLSRSPQLPTITIWQHAIIPEAPILMKLNQNLHLICSDQWHRWKWQNIFVSACAWWPRGWSRIFDGQLGHVQLPYPTFPFESLPGWYQLCETLLNLFDQSLVRKEKLCLQSLRNSSSKNNLITGKWLCMTARCNSVFKFWLSSFESSLYSSAKKVANLKWPYSAATCKAVFSPISTGACVHVTIPGNSVVSYSATLIFPRQKATFSGVSNLYIRTEFAFTDRALDDVEVIMLSSNM